MKLPLLSSKELCRFLEQEEFLLQRQRGSHRFYKHPDGRTTVVPIHAKKEISRGLLRAIIEQIGMSREEFLRKIKKK